MVGALSLTARDDHHTPSAEILLAQRTRSSGARWTASRRAVLTASRRSTRRRSTPLGARDCVVSSPLLPADGWSSFSRLRPAGSRSLDACAATCRLPVGLSSCAFRCCSKASFCAFFWSWSLRRGLVLWPCTSLGRVLWPGTFAAGGILEGYFARLALAAARRSLPLGARCRSALPAPGALCARRSLRSLGARCAHSALAALARRSLRSLGARCARSTLATLAWRLLTFGARCHSALAAARRSLRSACSAIGAFCARRSLRSLGARCAHTAPAALARRSRRSLGARYARSALTALARRSLRSLGARCRSALAATRRSLPLGTLCARTRCARSDLATLARRSLHPLKACCARSHSLPRGAQCRSQRCHERGRQLVASGGTFDVGYPPSSLRQDAPQTRHAPHRALRARAFGSLSSPSPVWSPPRQR